jgi:hypothetical protein
MHRNADAPSWFLGFLLCIHCDKTLIIMKTIHPHKSRLSYSLLGLCWVTLCFAAPPPPGPGTALELQFPKTSSPIATNFNLWGPASHVDEPESAFYSIGRTLRHFSLNPKLIREFHDFLRAQNIAPLSLLVPAPTPPQTLRRILMEPELLPVSGWATNGPWIVSKASHRGPEKKIPLHIERGGIYRCWIRYQGYIDGPAVTHFTLHRAGQDDASPLLYEEFNTLPAGTNAPQWHDFMAELQPGDYTITLGHVVRYYQVPEKTPFRDHQVDCLYLTDELWRDAPSDEVRADLRNRIAPREGRFEDQPPLDTPADKALWSLWQVRPSHWETAAANPRLFALSYEFWRREIDAIAKADYAAPPRDPVAGSVPDYRDPRRQVIVDPIWNMVANPYRIRTQREILEGDIDPLAPDAFYAWIMPGFFPVVRGQWERSGGGLAADHGATRGLAAGIYTVPHPGRWHLWVKFKNINYFEYFGVYADTLFGRAARWERNERLYPGGRAAWAKVGEIQIPTLSDAEIADQRDKVSKGIWIAGGAPVCAITQGVWQAGAGFLENTGTSARLFVPATLPLSSNFTIRARLSFATLPSAAAAFVFSASNQVDENIVRFDGSAKGSAFGTGTLFSTEGLITARQPFDFEITRAGERVTLKIDQKTVAEIPLSEPPGGRFGFISDTNGLRIHEFSTSGPLGDGLDLLRTIHIGLWMDKYINARTYRGVYALMLTDNADYRPAGDLMPKPSPKAFLRQMEQCGYTPARGYVLNAKPGIGLINQTWMPGAEPAEPVIDLVMARDTIRSAGLMFRNGQSAPVTLKISPTPLKSRMRAYPHAVSWRAVAFAPYGNGREEWSPFFLLRRPFLTLPPVAPAQAWITVDSTGVPPGKYESRIIVESAAPSGQTFTPRTVTLRVRIADIAVKPKQPILVHGWVAPPPGEEYRLDWFKRFNVWQGPFFSKKEMDRYGLKLQIYCQRHVNSNEIARQIVNARELGLGYDDWMFSIADEPTGTTAAELKEYITIGKMIRAADPKVRITLNPGEAARAATFQILAPYADLWNPYLLHLSYGPSGRDYLKKPWIWYTTPCYGDKSPGMAAEMYDQVRSVLRQPADCRGTAFFAPYYPWRDPWDTAHEHIRDVSVFVLPSRNGPVATPAWEALLEAVQHANLARMVRERAPADDPQAKKIWETGSMAEVIAWLEK